MDRLINFHHSVSFPSAENPDYIVTPSLARGRVEFEFPKDSESDFTATDQQIMEDNEPYDLTAKQKSAFKNFMDYAKKKWPEQYGKNS